MPTAAPSKSPGMMPLIVEMFPTVTQVAVMAAGQLTFRASTNFTVGETVGSGPHRPHSGPCEVHALREKDDREGAQVTRS